jgi:hypothetical protein
VRFLPDWLPGAGFKRKAIVWRGLAHDFASKPYQFVKDEMVNNLTERLVILLDT